MNLTHKVPALVVALAGAMAQAQNIEPRDARRDNRAAVGQPRYAVVLVSTSEAEARLPRPIPRQLQDHDVFTRERVVDGAKRTEFLLGPFATRSQAEAVLPRLSGFPQASVVALAEAEPGVRAEALVPAPASPPVSGVAPPAPAGPSVPAGPVGERRSAPTAEQVALRDQARLVPRGRVTVELGVSYSRAEQTLLLLPGERVEQNAVESTLGLRYGLRDGLQLSASVPGRYTRTAVVTSPGNPVPASRESRSGWGDPTLALLGLASSEGPWRPSLLWSLQAIVPGGGGDAGVGGGIVLAKSADPAVLFAGLSYVRGVRIDANDPERSLARHNLAFNLGNAIALNDVLAITGQLVGSYRTHRAPAGGVAAPRERYQLKLGTTYVLTPQVYFETQLAIGLGGASPDVTFGVSVPYSF